MYVDSPSAIDAHRDVALGRKTFERAIDGGERDFGFRRIERAMDLRRGEKALARTQNRRDLLARPRHVIGPDSHD